MIGKLRSLPVRECGLKSSASVTTALSGGDTPCAGVWIEIVPVHLFFQKVRVTPCAGVWIEIF